MKTWKNKILHPQYGECTVKEATDKECTDWNGLLAPISHGFVNFYDKRGEWVGWAGCDWAKVRIIHNTPEPDQPNKTKLLKPKRLRHRLLHDCENEGVMKNVRDIEGNLTAITQVLGATATYVTVLEESLKWISKNTKDPKIKNEANAALKKGTW